LFRLDRFIEDFPSRPEMSLLRESAGAWPAYFS